jgi:hypothetical protein
MISSGRLPDMKKSKLPVGATMIDLGDMVEISQFDIVENSFLMRWDSMVDGVHKVYIPSPRFTLARGSKDPEVNKYREDARRELNGST